MHGGNFLKLWGELILGARKELTKEREKKEEKGRVSLLNTL
jgi:hypothetical protein